MKTALVFALLAGVPLAQAGETSFSRQGAADPRGKVEVSNLEGSVEITTWDRPEFSIEADLEEGVDRVDVSSSPGFTTITVVQKRKTRQDNAARLRISVPAGSRIEVGTVSAGISLEGAYRSAQLRAVSGDINVDGGGEQLEVRTISGDAEVSAHGVPGRYQVESVSGGVVARDVAGELEANSTSGDVEASMRTAQRVRLRSISGNALLDATLGAQATVEAEMISGDIRARLRAAEGFRFDLSSMSGTIRNCFVEDQKLGSTGAGNGSVRLRTNSGSVSLCDR